MGLSVERGEPYDRLGDWAEALKPEFLGPVFGGRRYGCLLTWHDPVFQKLLWAFCYADNPLGARQLAVREITEQRWQGMITEQILDGRVNVYG